jgi:hypothetical protein
MLGGGNGADRLLPVLLLFAIHFSVAELFSPVQ